MKYYLAPLFLAVWCVSLRADEEMVLRGNVAGPIHRHSYICKDQYGKDPDGNFTVIYALDGSKPEIAAEFHKVIEDYFPEKGMDCQAAVELQEQIDARVRYYIDAPAEILKKIDSPYGIGAFELVGKLEVRDGKKWIVVVPDIKRIKNADLGKVMRSCPRKLMMEGVPDMPLLPAGEPLTLKIDDKLGANCIHVPPGKFLMGKPYWMVGQYAEEPPHVVTLTKPYYMSETVVTQGLYEAVMEEVRHLPNRISTCP